MSEPVRTRPTLRHISFRRLGTSDVHQRYLEDDRDIASLLGKRPRTVQELLKRAPTGAGRLVGREQIAQAMLTYAQRFQAPEAVLAAARSLAEPDVQVVITGQQPGICGGPLFNLHKVATAIRLCREINAQPGGPRAVPVFWNHSDDHDLEEANRLFMVSAAQELQKFRLDIDRGGEPLRAIRAGREMEKLLTEIDGLVPQSEFRDWALGLFKPRHPNEPLGDAMARMMFELFGKHGLLVIEPRDLPAEAFPPLQRWWGQSNQIRDKIRQTSDELSDLGLDITMDPAATMMFQMVGNRREALADGEVAGNPADLSPAALLRPLWQDACLPTIAFVVGPGELAYLAVVAPLYRTLGVPQPLLVPRASLTLVEPSLQRLLARFGWDLPDLEPGPDKLAASVQGDEGSGIEDEIDDLATRLRADLDAISSRLEKLDASMLSALDRARTKALEEITRLAAKIRTARENREGTGLRQIRRLCANLRPRGRLQERVLSPLLALVAHGKELGDILVDAADPFCIEHGVLEL
ncbi:MAG: bacillithiol biosynthesis BshC [Planctomycetes bacterium]|nr:bacillithiol biosynthesis BshC [Planctomycetota bacterium]